MSWLKCRKDSIGCCSRKPVLVRHPLMLVLIFSDFISIMMGYLTDPSAEELALTL